MNTHALVPTVTSRLAVTQLLEGEHQLGFPLRVLGRSNAPIIPQRVGGWWLEPFTPATELPARAAARLAAVLATGLAPKAIVVFHELPATASEEPRPRGKSSLGQSRFISLAKVAAARAPGIGKSLLRTIEAAVDLDARLTGQFLGWLRGVGNSIDPCLVVVTEDGQWIEIDRWYTAG